MRVLAALCLLGFLVAAPVLAGPNEGGVLFVHAAGIIQSDFPSGCGIGTVPTDCEDAVTRVDSPDFVLWKIYAAFPEEGSPRLKGITFGIEYGEGITILQLGPCPDGSFELPGSNWPDSPGGTSVVWTETITDHLAEIYWFWGYGYGGEATLFFLRDNPDSGDGQFGDDATPSNLDDIAGFGSLGFYMDGETACPAQPELGACCVSGGECLILTEEECYAHPESCREWHPGTSCDPNPCTGMCPGACCYPDGTCEVTEDFLCDAGGGAFQGWNTNCDPNPCEPNTVAPADWGRIKSRYVR